MKWLCSVGVAVSLAMQPALAENLFGNHPLTPEARDAFVTDLLKKMTVDEKIGQLRLISVGPDNPKEAIREMIKDGQVGAIFNTVTRQDIRQMQDQVMALSRLKIPLFFAYDVVHGQRTVFPISLGLASSFNLDAVRTVGRVSAYEAADDGLNMTLGADGGCLPGSALGTRLRRLWRRYIFNLHHGRNHGESDAGQKSGGSLLGDDQRETFCRLWRR
ncbi:hypothetical protein G9X29_13155 [Salmonella enterica subsp. enterica serovar Adjame]|nr:hypothetical protein G9X29_13155 [Salmonella enterica subsp. enterica serovar Adjame]